MRSFGTVVGTLFWIAVACGPAIAERRAEGPAEPSSSCVSFTEAKRHIGSQQCVSGKVLAIERSEGMTYLNFCEDFRVCPFAVVVFEEDARHVGSVNSLLGQTIEIRGKVKEYDGRAQIVLEFAEQLGAGVKKLPPVPREFDVERQGKFSVGTFHAAKSRKASHKKAALPATLDVEQDPND